MRKFTVAFDEEVFRELDRDARDRNISLQAFLRAVVIPEWIKGGNTRTTSPASIQGTSRESGDRGFRV